MPRFESRHSDQKSRFRFCGTDFCFEWADSEQFTQLSGGQLLAAADGGNSLISFHREWNVTSLATPPKPPVFEWKLAVLTFWKGFSLFIAVQILTYHSAPKSDLQYEISWSVNSSLYSDLHTECSIVKSSRPQSSNVVYPSDG